MFLICDCGNDSGFAKLASTIGWFVTSFVTLDIE